MKAQRIISLVSISILFLLSSCGPGQFLAPTVTPPPSATLTPTLTPIPSSTPTIVPSPTVTPTPTLTPLPPVFATMFVNEYGTFTVYRQRGLWESAVSGAGVLTEDFEKDTADYGELTDPYLTGNGFLLEGGNCPAQIIQDASLLPGGNVLHFRDFGCGLTLIFPNNTAVTAFGFDYRPSEDWKLTVSDTVLDIPKGRAGFIGIVFHSGYPTKFTLTCDEHAQGGLTVDNISYIPTASP